MDAMEAILSRRSIRKYTAEPVPDPQVKELLEAAMSAPSASNQQAWQFVVISDRQILDEVPKFHAYSQMLREAPLAILVCGEPMRVDFKDYPNIQAWLERMKALPNWQKVNQPLANFREALKDKQFEPI